MKFSLKSLVVIAVAALPFAAQAHKAFLLPSTTVLTESDHKITVDAAVSNDLFYFNHVPMRLDDLQITAPDGSSVAPENVATGAFRSVFDVRSEEHTSELQSLMRPSYAVFCLKKKNKN